MAEENTGVSLTLKGGAGYDAPWIVLHGASVGDAHKMLEELVESETMTLLAGAAKLFQAANKGPGWSNQKNAGASSGTTPTIPSNTPATSAAPAADPQQLLRQELGAEVIATETNSDVSPSTSDAGGAVPREVMFCELHGEPRQYFGPGVSTKTGNPFNASYRCPQRGCAAKPPKPLALWQRDDGKWEERKWVKR